MAESQEYRDAFKQAEEDATDHFEAEMCRRAAEGYDEPVVYQGSLQYEPVRDEDGQIKRDKRGRPQLSTEPLRIRRYSDNLLMFLLKARRPDKYRDNANVSLTGPQGAPLSIEVRFVNPPEASG